MVSTTEVIKGGVGILDMFLQRAHVSVGRSLLSKVEIVPLFNPKEAKVDLAEEEALTYPQQVIKRHHPEL